MFAKNGIPVKINTGIYNDNDSLAKYQTKIEKLLIKPIEKIRITTMGTLIAVYVSHEGIKSYKDQIRTTFGGKTISKKEAYNMAKLFVERIKGDSTTIVEDPNVYS